MIVLERTAEKGKPHEWPLLLLSKEMIAVRVEQNPWEKLDYNIPGNLSHEPKCQICIPKILEKKEQDCV